MSDVPTFDQRYDELRAYRQEHGDCLVPVSPDDPNHGLGVWVDAQRLEQRKFQKGDPSSTLTSVKIAALDRLGFVWDSLQDVEDEGTTTGFVSPDSSNIRKCSEESSEDASDENNRAYSSKNNGLTESSDDEDHDGSSIPTNDFAWNLYYKQLKDHMESFYPDGGFVGSCKFENKDLGEWVELQRDLHAKNQLSEDRFTKLQELRFQWEKEPAEGTVDVARDKATASDAEPTKYDSAYEAESSNGNPESPTLRKNGSDYDDSDAESDIAVKQYRKRHVTDDDSDNESLSRTNNEEWDQNFNWLTSHMEKHYPSGGYVNALRCPVERRTWVCQLRKKYWENQSGGRTDLTAERIQKLENAGFLWEQVEEEDDDLEERSKTKKRKGKWKNGAERGQWYAYFGKLKNFMKKHNMHETGGYVDAKWCKKGFSDWVIKQRDQYGLKMLGLESDITDEQIEKLESIGFHWKRNPTLTDEMEQRGTGMNDSGHSSRERMKRKCSQDSKGASKKTKFASPAKKSNQSTWEEDFERLRGILVARPQLRSRLYPITEKEDKRFYRWCYKQRYNYRQLIAGKESVMKDYQAQLLKDIGFLVEVCASERSESSDHSSDEDDFSENESSEETPRQQARSTTSPVKRRGGGVPWETKYKNLARIMKERYPNGGFVKLPYDHNLSNWVYVQRYQYRKKLMKDDRIKKLERLGFLWEDQEEHEKESSETSDYASDQDHHSVNEPWEETPRQQARSPTSTANRSGRVSWETHYEKLALFMKKNFPDGGFVSPPTDDMKFYYWVYSQRSMYRRGLLAEDRIKMLQRLRFHWEQPRKHKKSQGCDEEVASSVATKQSSESDSDDESDQEDEESGGEPASDQEDEESSDEEADESDPAPKHTLRRNSETIPGSKDSAYEALDKTELLPLFLNQMHLAKMLRKENAELQTELQASSLEQRKCNTKLSKAKDKNQMLITKIREHQNEMKLWRNEKSELESKLHSSYKYKAKLKKAKGRVNHLEKENETLRTDNEELRRSLKTFTRREKKKRKHSEQKL